MYFINKLLVLGVLASAWSVSANTLEYVDTGTIDTATGNYFFHNSFIFQD